MRKGFSLVELMVVIAVLLLILWVIDGLFTTMLSDVPKSGKTIQENSVLLTMLRQMEQDIDAAENLPQSIDEYSAGEDLLLIEQAAKVIHYQIKDGTVYRYGYRDNQQIPEDLRYWFLPDTKIQWLVHRQNGKGYAAEIRHHVEYVLRGHLIKKMENSNMYFVGTFE